MKALMFATLLSAGLIAGVLFWALARGDTQSGEPRAQLAIEQPGVNPAIADTVPEPAMSAPQSTAINDKLVEPSQFGPLPKRADDGQEAARAYARPNGEPSDTVPRIAILLSGLGLNRTQSMLAVQRLPAPISLAFSAYGDELGKLADEAQRIGHETLLQVPLEPLDYPNNDTGPKTLLVAAAANDNEERLAWSLGRFTRYFAVANNKGGKFLSSEEAVRPLFSELKRRGLHFFNDSAAGGKLDKLAGQVGLGYAHADIELDSAPDAASIMTALNELEALARRTGFAIGAAQINPAIIERLGEWAPKLAAKGIRLVPLSAAYAHKDARKDREM